MSSYHTSFTYKEKNSFDEGYIIVAFEPDSGFKDTYLTMENVSDVYYDGTKRFDYGSKYSSSAEVYISIIKKDGTDMSLKDFRSCAQWLTGARVNSWLDMYVEDTLIYSFLGKFLNLEQYKFDARTIGCRVTFSSISPWAYSSPQVFNCVIGQSLYVIENEDTVILTKDESEVAMASTDIDSTLPFGIDDDGVLYVNAGDSGSYFDVVETTTDTLGNKYHVVGVDTAYKTTINNLTDDLYTYINLDIDYENISSNLLSIKNESIGEETRVLNMKINEKISISANQFIISDFPNRTFGDDFNFVWPRLQPGENSLVISGGGSGVAYFTYRYPMKIGDCTIDIDINGNGIYCDDGDDGNSGEIFTGTISWEKITNTPTTLDGYGITDAYTADQVDTKISNIEIGDGVTVGDLAVDEDELNTMLDEVLG